MSISLEIKRGNTDQFFVNEGAKMESHLIVITLENAVIKSAIRAQHLMSDRMCINCFDS